MVKCIVCKIRDAFPDFDIPLCHVCANDTINEYIQEKKNGAINVS
jgi:hypothetical protein